MRLASYLQSAKFILGEYKGKLPFAAWLKQYFRQHKKFGSKDRKLIADFCFCYYRLGKSFLCFGEDERLLVGQFYVTKQVRLLKS